MIGDEGKVLEAVQAWHKETLGGLTCVQAVVTARTLEDGEVRSVGEMQY